MTDCVEECEFPPCHQPAVAHLMRPFKEDRVALCEKHKLYALALLAELEEIEREGRSPDDR